MYGPFGRRLCELWGHNSRRTAWLNASLMDSELSHVWAWCHSDRELGIEGLGETVEDAKAGYGATSFEPSYG
jgi:hypothetical protein